MAESLIDKFLNVGLFDIGEDDERLKLFQKAAADLSKGFSGSPEKIIPGILTAIDPNVPENDPILMEAESAVKAQWKAFSNKYPKRPKFLLRPVILEALAQNAANNTSAAIVIWLCGSSLLGQIEPTSETAIIKDFLERCYVIAEEEAVSAWASSTNGELSLPKFDAKIAEPKVVKIDRAVLLEKFKRHVTAYGGVDTGISGPIADAIEEMAAPLSENTSATTGHLKTALKDYGKELNASAVS